MTDLVLVGYQIGYEQRAFWRNRAAAFFTFAFPLILLVIFGNLNRKSNITALGAGHLVFAEYFVPSMLAFGVMSACFVNVGTSLSVRRQSGQLKRVRGAPLRPWVFLAGVIGNALVLSIMIAGLIVVSGLALFSVRLPSHWLTLTLCVAVGAVAFCALGVAATGLTIGANAEAAGAVLNGIFFPVVFISGAFFPVAGASVLARVAKVLPVHPFIIATFSAFDPRFHGAGLSASDLLLIAAWGSVGVVVAIRTFKWEPVKK
jgi:ABC-2 type transport system permease protein